MSGLVIPGISSVTYGLGDGAASPPAADVYVYLKPTTISSVSKTLTWTLSSPFHASLDIVSDQDVSKAILFEDGIPLTQDQWSFVDGTTIELAFTPNNLLSYTFSYNALIRVESNPIDLGSAYADYIWFADYYSFNRSNITPTYVTTSVGISFDQFGRAKLEDRAVMDKTVATMSYDNGTSTGLINRSEWDFIDANTVQINAGSLDDTSLYNFTYKSELNIPTVGPQVTAEIRSATSIAGLAAAVWQLCDINQVVGNAYRYHQLRLTFNNVVDVRDVRLYSMLLKGLNMYGTNGYVPVLRQ